MMLIDKDLLSLAGEYRVCSELNKRGVFATVTYGHGKAVDVYAISDRKKRALKIEVKTTQKEQSGSSFSVTTRSAPSRPHATKPSRRDGN